MEQLRNIFTNMFKQILLSTRMPPQRLDWWEQEARSRLQSAHPRPRELADQIIAEAGLGLMDNREALHHQLERAQEEASEHEEERQEIEGATIGLWKQWRQFDPAIQAQS